MPDSLRRIGRGLWIVLPGLLASALFAMILSNGNALFAKLTGRWAAAIGSWITNLHLDVWRCSFWGIIVWGTLPFLKPSPAPEKDRPWTRLIPRMAGWSSARTARLQWIVTLALMNGLFCFVNTIDVVYLWARHTLPADVGYSAFVHQGVASLITAVLFSALLIAGIFCQERDVAGSLILRLLGLAWIGQNLVLLAGVMLRVKLYVDAFDLTLVRVNLIFFLALVATGFVLLSLYVWFNKPLGWLLYGNFLAAFFLFYSIQFLDTNRFVAAYNVKLWKQSGQTRNLDIVYLESLGPSAYDFLLEICRTSRGADAVAVAACLARAGEAAQIELRQTSWAGWQLRDWYWQRKLLAELHK